MSKKIDNRIVTDKLKLTHNLAKLYAVCFKVHDANNKFRYTSELKKYKTLESANQALVEFKKNNTLFLNKFTPKVYEVWYENVNGVIHLKYVGL